MATIRRGAALILLLARSSRGFRGNAFVANVPLLRRHSKKSYYSTGGPILSAKPKKAGSTVDSYQTVSVNCSKCQQRLFRYKKKNGTKSNLVKCYIERISEDSAGVLALAVEAQKQTLKKSDANNNSSNVSSSRKNNSKQKKQKRDPKNNQKEFENGKPKEPPSDVFLNQLDPAYSWECPGCNTQFARSSMIHGRPALKLVGGKIRMTKK